MKRPKIRAEWIFTAGLLFCGLAAHSLNGWLILAAFACLLAGLYALGD